MAVIGLVVHQGRDEAAGQAVELAAWLRSQGHVTRVPAQDAKVDGLVAEPVPAEVFADGLNLVVSLGGDGSIIRAVELVAAKNVPVLGVNFGQLGYLSAIEPQSSSRAVERFLAGAYDLEERMMLEVRLIDGDGSELGTEYALNEVVLERIAGATTVRIAVSIDGEFFTTYPADALIIATPTGSTAYAFSARGPIVAAQHRCMQLTPVSPHMLFDRTLVLGPETSLELEVDGHRNAAVILDGRQVAELGEGARVVCTAAERVARLVTLGPRNFHRVLKTKFGLEDR